MFVVTVAHKDAMWIMCYGPFDTMLEANEFARVKMQNHRVRVNALNVIDPND